MKSHSSGDTKLKSGNMTQLKYWILLLFGIFAHQATSQVQRSLTERYSPALKAGDEITISGIGYTRSVGLIRLHSEMGSCDTGPQTRNVWEEPLTCNPLIIKLLTRKHRANFFKKGMGENNHDVFLQSAPFPGLIGSLPYSIKITVTYSGYDVQLNDDSPISFVTHGRQGRVIMIRATSGLFSSITLKSNTKIRLNVPNCGLSGASLFSSKFARITNGQDALPGAYPWQAAIRRRTVYYWHPYHHMCGASLIDNCWVLTAAHCVGTVKRYKSNYVIRVGDLYNGENENIQYKRDEHEQDIDIEEVYVHENFTLIGQTPINDIAMIHLKAIDGQCVSYSDKVYPVCLPEIDIDSFPSLTECHITGWGAKNWTDRPRHYPHILQRGIVRLQDFGACQSLYSDNKNITQIQEGMICAGSKGVDTCQGDSGGPLVCPRHEADITQRSPFVLWGVTSWGEKCADTEKPGVYTKVTKYLDWINHVRAGVL